MELSQLGIKRQLKRAKLFEIQKLIRQIRKLERRKGTEAQLEKSRRKVERLVKIIETLKDLSLQTVAGELCTMLEEGGELTISRDTASCGDCEERAKHRLLTNKTFQRNIRTLGGRSNKHKFQKKKEFQAEKDDEVEEEDEELETVKGRFNTVYLKRQKRSFEEEEEEEEVDWRVKNTVEASSSEEEMKEVDEEEKEEEVDEEEEEVEEEEEEEEKEEEEEEEKEEEELSITDYSDNGEEDDIQKEPKYTSLQEMALRERTATMTQHHHHHNNNKDIDGVRGGGGRRRRTKELESMFVETLSNPEDEAASSVGTTQRKNNRPGQRTRQKNWEKMFGKRAKHLSEGKKSQDRIIPAKHLSSSKIGKAMTVKGKRTIKQRSIRTEVKGPTTTDRDKEKLHPSWEAQRRRKTKETGIHQFQGERIVFSD